MGGGGIATKNAKLWCAAAVTWGLAAVAGMGMAVFVPDLLPEVSQAAPRSVAAAGRDASVGTLASAGGATGASDQNAAGQEDGKVAVDDAPGARQRAADEAVHYARAHGWRSGIAILDLQTGDVVEAGDSQGYFHSMSTVKLLIAARLLASGAIPPNEAGPARAMISASSDAPANALYAAAGGDSLVAWTASRYNIPRLGTPPTRGANQWGSTQLTPRGTVAFLKAAYEDPAVSSWLVDAMLHLTPVAADGTNQIFGLRAADPMAVVKQGWGGDANPNDVEGTPSVGYVDRGRYAVAIFTSKLPEEKLAAAQDVVTAQAKLLLPNGRMPRL